MSYIESMELAKIISFLIFFLVVLIIINEPYKGDKK